MNRLQSNTKAILSSRSWVGFPGTSALVTAFWIALVFVASGLPAQDLRTSTAEKAGKPAISDSPSRGRTGPKTIRVVITQSCEDVPGFRLPVEGEVNRLLALVDFRVAPAGAEAPDGELDLNLSWNPGGHEYNEFGIGSGTTFYTSASVFGKAVFRQPNRPAWTSDFRGFSEPPDKISAIASQKPSAAPFHKAWQAGEHVGCLLKLGRDVQGPSVLVSLLKNPNRRVRLAAIYLLGDARWRDGVPVIVPLLRDPSADVREQAAEALGMIGDAEGVSPLIIALGDGNEDVRRAAVVALGLCKNNRAVPALLPMLRTREGDINPKVAEALGRIGDPRAVPALADAIRKQGRRGCDLNAVMALGNIPGPIATSILVELAHDSSEAVRQTVMEALGEREGPAVILALLEGLEDSYQPVSLAAYRSAYKAGRKVKPGEPAADALLVVLARRDERIYAHALNILGEIGEVRLLRVVLTPGSPPGNWDYQVIQAVRNCSKQTRSGDDPTIWEPGLADPRPEVRQATVEALGRIGGPRVPGLLLQTLADPDADVRGGALRAFSQAAVGLAPDDPALNALASTLKDRPLSVRVATAEAMAATGIVRFLPVLMAAAEDGKLSGHPAFEKALLKLAGHIEPGTPESATVLSGLASNDGPARRCAALAAGAGSDVRSITPLLELLSDPDEKLVQSARQALGDLMARLDVADESVRVLLGTLQSPPFGSENVARLLGSLADARGSRLTKLLPAADFLRLQVVTVRAWGAVGSAEAVRYLSFVLESAGENQVLRLEVLSALGSKPSRDGLRLLVQSVEDPDSQVRSAAVAVLETLAGERLGPDRRKWEKWLKKNGATYP